MDVDGNIRPAQILHHRMGVIFRHRAIRIPQKDYVNQVFDRADLIIAIGYDIVECAPAKWGARPDRTILHIDTAPADVN